jgi:hypothetical protein
MKRAPDCERTVNGIQDASGRSRSHMKSTDGRKVESYRDQRDVEVKGERREPISWAGPLPPGGWMLAGRKDRKVPLIELAPGSLLEAKH